MPLKETSAAPGAATKSTGASPDTSASTYGSGSGSGSGCGRGFRRSAAGFDGAEPDGAFASATGADEAAGSPPALQQRIRPPATARAPPAAASGVTVAMRYEYGLVR